MMLSLFFFYQEEVEATTIDYIVLTDLPNGTPYENVTLPINGSLTIYASGYNSTLGYMDLVDVDWYEFKGLGFFNTTYGKSTTYTAKNIGSTTILGLSFTLNINDTFDLNITPPANIDWISIRDASCNGGNLVENITYIIGTSDTFYAAGYNSSIGYVCDVSVAWKSDNTSVGTVTTPGISTIFNAVGLGTCTVSADYGGGITNDTGNLTVVTPDEIIIRDAPNNGGSPVLNWSYYIWENDTFWAAGYNETYGYLDDVRVIWESTNKSVGTVSPNSSSPFAEFYAVGTGTCVISADYGGGIINSTGSITVLIYNIDNISIQDSPAPWGIPINDMVYKLGDSDVFYAVGYNLTYGCMGPVTVNWTSNETGVGTVTTPGSSTTFNAVGYGTCFVTADYGGSITDDTGILAVAALDYILIRDGSSGGGIEVGNMFYPTWAYDTFWAAAYNSTHGYLGDVSSTWNSSNTSVGTVTSPGSSTFFDAVGDGNCIVTADYSGLTDETGIITVSSYTVDYVQVRDAPGGKGNVVIDPSYPKGSVDTYYGAMYNNIVDYLCDVPSDSTWISSNTSVVAVTSPGNSTTVTCNNTNSGTSVITLWPEGFINKTNTTTVTVLNWTIDYISIRDSSGGSGKVVGNKTYCVWDTDKFYAIAINRTYGYLMDVPATWSSDNPNVGNVTPSGTSSNFTAQWIQTDSTCNVTASYQSFSNTSGILTVLAPRVDYIQIRDAPEGGGAPITSISYYSGDTDIYYGAMYNNTVNFIDSVPQTSTWMSSNTSIVTVTSPGNSSNIKCNDTNFGTAIVTLDDGLGRNSSTTVTVLKWKVDYILIRDAPLGGGKNLTDPANYPSYPVGHVTKFYGAMYNNTVGYIAEVASTSTWESNQTSIIEVSSSGVYSTITCSNKNYGVAKITLGEWMGHNASTQVTVLEPTIDLIKILDDPNGTGDVVGDMIYFKGNVDTYHAAAFNLTANYLYDISVTWSSSNTSVGTVSPSSGTSTTFTAVGLGTCFVKAVYGGIISNTTGTLTVTSIQAMIDNANAGDTINISIGTYYEHLTITKSITLKGENKETTIIDGEGSGKVLYISGDNVSITGFTIQNGEYSIYFDESDSTKITYNIIQDYDYGIYNYKTTDGYIAYNEITDGEYGIVTYEAYNDAIRYNTISYNSEYGAKDYNSKLKNCFNWNYFHHNKIAYYYDPDTELPTLEFDGNILEDNYIGVKVENASTISITNNTISRNEYGIYLINASPNIADNTISTSAYGIYAEYSSPTVLNNIISEISQYGIYGKFGDSLKIINNTVMDAGMIFFDSTIKELWLKDSNITKFNTTVESSHLDEGSNVEARWFLYIRVVDEEGKPIEGAAVLVYDAYDSLISTHTTNSEGWTDSIQVIENLQSSTSSKSYNPYRIMVVKDSFTNTSMVIVEEDTDMVISLEKGGAIIKPSGPAFPWGLVILVGFVGAIGIGGLCIEVLKYGLWLFFLPLYIRIKKEKLLDQPTRHKIHGYIIGNPGAHFGLIKQDLGIPNGQLVHHLRQLTRAHIIYSQVDGTRKRFYPVDYPKPKSGEHYFNDTQEKILEVIENNSGISQKKVASSVGISRQVAGYHLSKMEQKGVLKKKVIGRETKYYASKRYNVSTKDRCRAMDV
jgi:parallel beta-helix repeat protein